MEETFFFYPPRRKGTIFHLGLISGLLTGAGWAVWKTSQVQVTLDLLPYLLIILGSLIGIPLLTYRLYALHNAHYRLDRGSLHIQWGWRQETIPMTAVSWVHRAEDLENAPDPSLISWPGSVIGKQNNARSSPVEFLAARKKDLIVIAAQDSFLVISPADTDQFLETYNQLIELGSLQHVPSQTIRPSFLLSTLRSQRSVLISLAAGFLLNLSLLIWTLSIIPQREEISLGFTPQGTPHQPLDSVRLILLPIINFTAYLSNFVLALFLYRREKNQLFAHLLWGSSVLIAVFFHIGLYLLQR